MTRIFGGRDAAMGAGGSIAVGQGSGGGDWLSMMALVDAFDGIVMLATPGLPKRARLIGVGAIASAVVHLYLSRDIAARGAGQRLGANGANRDRHHAVVRAGVDDLDAHDVSVGAFTDHRRACDSRSDPSRPKEVQHDVRGRRVPRRSRGPTPRRRAPRSRRRAGSPTGCAHDR